TLNLIALSDLMRFKYFRGGVTMSLKLLIWAGFIVFLIVLILIGYVSAKKTKTMSDFAIGSAGLGPVVLGLSFASTVFSAATFMGYPGYAYSWGFSDLWLLLALI